MTIETKFNIGDRVECADTGTGSEIGVVTGIQTGSFGGNVTDAIYWVDFTMTLKHIAGIVFLEMLCTTDGDDKQWYRDSLEFLENLIDADNLQLTN